MSTTMIETTPVTAEGRAALAMVASGCVCTDGVRVCRACHGHGHVKTLASGQVKAYRFKTPTRVVLDAVERGYTSPCKACMGTSVVPCASCPAGAALRAQLGPVAPAATVRKAPAKAPAAPKARKAYSGPRRCPKPEHSDACPGISRHCAVASTPAPVRKGARPATPGNPAPVTVTRVAPTGARRAPAGTAKATAAAAQTVAIRTAAARKPAPAGMTALAQLVAAAAKR